MVEITMLSNLLLQIDANSFYTNNVVLIFGVLMIASLGVWLYFLKKKNPDLDIGPLIATAMSDKHETIFMSLIFLEYVATSLIAATVHGPQSHGLEMSPLGRVIAHIALSITGTVCQFVLATDIAIIFVKKQPIGNRIGNALTMLMVGFLAFYIPYLNLTLIASATGETIAFQTWWYSISPFTTESELQALYLKIGYPPDYNPWANLSTVLQVCIATAFVIHYGLTPIEGLRTISSKKRRGMLMKRVYKDLEEKEEGDKEEGKEKEKAKKSPIDDAMKGEQNKIKEIVPNAEFLLKRIGYKDQEKIRHLAEAIQKAIIGDNSVKAQEDALKLSFRLASLKIRANTIDKGSDQNKEANKKKLLEDIRSFLSGKAKGDDGNLLSADKRGLGISIKVKN